MSGGNVVGLGVLKLVMGLPLFAVAGWVTWILLRKIVPKSDQGESEQSGEDAGSNPGEISG